MGSYGTHGRDLAERSDGSGAEHIDGCQQNTLTRVLRARETATESRLEKIRGRVEAWLENILKTNLTG